MASKPQQPKKWPSGFFFQGAALISKILISSFLILFSAPASPELLKITVKTDSSVIISWLPPRRNFVPITGKNFEITFEF